MANFPLRTAPASIAKVNLADPRTFVEYDLDGFWRTLRTTSPVYWHPWNGDRPGFWVLSRYADIMTVYRDTESFTSERGNILESLLGDGDPAAGRVLELVDGRRHRELRTVLASAFTPAALAHIADRVRDNTRRLVIEAVDRRKVDFAQDIASKIAIAAVCDLLGIPERDRGFVLELTRSALSSEGPESDEAGTAKARHGLLLYFSGLLDERRPAPGDDVISRMALGTVEGRGLSDDEIVLNCYSLVLGNETNRLAMIDAVATLAGHEEQWQALRNGTVPVGQAVEEVLRWSSPTLHFGRTAVRPGKVAGTTIAPGDVVTLWNISANRDEAVFPEPNRFDLARTPNRHLTFGHGPHFCIGAHLARVEVRELLTALRDLTSGFVIIDPPGRIYSNLLIGMSSLPTRFEPA